MFDLILNIGMLTNPVAKNLAKRVGCSYKSFLFQGQRGAFFVIPEKTVEEQERKFPQAEAEEYLKKHISYGKKVLVTISGLEKIAAIALRLLYILRDSEITIMLLTDSSQTFRKEQRLHERTLWGVLQEYARSGKFKEILLIDYQEIKKLLQGIPLLSFKQKREEILSSTLFNVGLLRAQPSLLDPLADPSEEERIFTIGVANIEDGTIVEFFDIEEVTSRSYLFFLNKDRLESDSTILDKIDYIKAQKATALISVGVYPSDFEEDFVYTLAYTQFIQNI